MRLINTITLEFDQFFGEDRTPPYAILSHTWGNDKEEVGYQDWQTPQRQSKIGFRKIWFCCLQARRDGLQWAWVDT
jgi:hypothetical protein